MRNPRKSFDVMAHSLKEHTLLVNAKKRTSQLKVLTGSSAREKGARLGSIVGLTENEAFRQNEKKCY